ncbi:CS1 type fimbrial major subunit [Shewanella japonica]|uniref:CS1 type fimbrial major subunit n=1 Tax=Shewanella japonica TaxID=93973 RepID=UPI000E73F975|nr:CS1 type fimbrial major subunit [Shewanella japonica]
MKVLSVNKLVAVASFGVMNIFLSSGVMAAETTEIEVSAEIPAADFHYRPASPISGVQEMEYNLLNSTLEPLSYTFSYKKGNAQNGITAELNEDASLWDGGAEKIAMVVDIDGKAITQANPVEVVGGSDNEEGSQVLTLTPAEPTAGQTGSFTSTVSLSFEAVVP